MLRRCLLIANVFAHENASAVIEGLKAIAQGVGHSGPWETTSRAIRAGQMPSHSLIISDNPARLARNTYGLVQFLAAALTKGNEVYVPGYFDLRFANPNFREIAAFLEAIVRSQKAVKGIRIKEGLFLARSRGGLIHRKSITPEVTQAVIDEYQLCKSIRQTERSLRAKGYSISRSSIHKIVGKYGGS